VVDSMGEFSKVLVTGGAGFIGSYMVDALMLLNACDKLKFMGALCY
jgi:UDP-glucose 4-epimerase